MKKFLIAFMAVLLILPTLLNTSAQAASNVKEENQVKQVMQVSQQQTGEFTFEDIMALKPYISVKNGLFKVDTSSAIKDGNNKDLVKMQKDYLSDLNKEIKNGTLRVENNLEIVSLKTSVADGGFQTLASCSGKSTQLAYHWWGVSRYMNSCEANKFSADMAAVAAGYTGAGIVAAIWFPGVGVAGGVIAAYAALMSARAAANNAYGTGIYVGITYAAFFNIDPQ